MQINNLSREFSNYAITRAVDRERERERACVLFLRSVASRSAICIFNAFWGGEYLWGISQFDTSHMRHRDHEPQNCKSKIRIHFFLRALLRSGLHARRYVCMCARVYVRVCARVCAKTKPEVLDVVRGAEIPNAGHVDAKTPPPMIQFASAILPLAPVLPFIPFLRRSFPTRNRLARISGKASRVSSWREDILERVNLCATYRDCLLSPCHTAPSPPFAPWRRKFSFYGPSRGCNFYFRSTDRMHLGAAPEP